MDRARASNEPWSIVLAGGSGARLAPLIQLWLGRRRPKQYCAFVGTRSMVQHTVDRARALSPLDRTVAVIARDHLALAASQLTGRCGRIFAQPINRETLPGLFFPLGWIRDHDPDATVVVYPADHFVYPEDRFVDVMREAVEVAERHPERIVVLGVTPDGRERDYGWVLPADGPVERGVRPVAALIHPGVVDDAQAASFGGLWNTMIVCAKVRTLWRLGAQLLPRTMTLCARAALAVGSADEREQLETVYSQLTTQNLSSHLLRHVPEHALVLEMTDVVWRDWGRPERITSTLQWLARQGEGAGVEAL